MEDKEQLNEKTKFSLWDFFIALIDRFLSKKTNYKEDKMFFENDGNLYDEKGELTLEYKAKIKEYEDYLRTNPMSDFLQNEYKENEMDSSVLEGICEFTDKRHELFVEYDRAQKEQGILFDEQKFAEEMAIKNISSIEDKEKAKTLLTEIIEKDIEEMLKDSNKDVSGYVKEVLQETIERRGSHE